MIPQQHLSDEAVAAFADGVLTGHARGRAQRHCAECAECAEAVRGQREAVMVLRDAPAPALPTDLLDKLRGLPGVTPISAPPTVFMPDGSTMLATGAPLGTVAAFVPPAADSAHRHRLRPGPWTTSLAVVALTGALAAGAASSDSDPSRPSGGDPARTVTHRSAPDRQSTSPLLTAVDLVAYVPRGGNR